MNARIMEVIRVEASEGKGTADDPCRWVIRYFHLDGELLAEVDPYAEKMKRDADERKGEG